MSDFKSRLLEEKAQLDDRTTKLGLFLDGDKILQVDPVQQSLLGLQYLAMQTYQRCLLERIHWLNESDE